MLGFETAELKAKLAALDKSQAVIEFNMDGTIITANANFLAVMGYTLADLQGRHHSMLMPPEEKDGRDYRAFWDALNRGEFQSGQFRRLGKGGAETWLEASYNPLLGRNGKPFKVVKFATDITRAKQEYADFTSQIAAIGRAQAVIQFTLDGVVLEANENFLQAVGYRLDEIRGQHHSIFVDAAFRASREYQDFWAALRQGRFQAAQYRRLGKGGREVWLEASYNPILDANGKPYKVIKFATDVTDRKRRTADVSVQVNELVGMLSSSATELQATAQALSASADLASNKSHAVSAASEELSASIREISRQLSEASAIVQHAVASAQSSEKRVGGMLDKANSIGEVTDTIAEIAGQTNLLALNATIEAARAGETGKGFAVVASEVKSLASRTARATGEIGEQVKGIQEATTETATGIKEIAGIIERVSMISGAVASAVEEQSAATQEVSGNIVGVLQASEETAHSSVNLVTVSGDLATRASSLERLMADFVATL